MVVEDFLNIDGLRIRYWTNSFGNRNSIDNTKPTIVLFHGNAFSLDNWKQTKTLDALAKEGYPVYAVDLPVGEGSKSDRIDQRRFQKYRDLVPMIERIFAGLGIGSSQNLVIVGPSLGGGFAVAYALANPKQVAALVLVAPALHMLGPEDEDKVPELLQMPVLLVWGDGDTFIRVDEYGRSLKQQLAHSKLVILKGAGHAAYLDKPGEFNEILMDFLSDLA